MRNVEIKARIKNPSLFLSNVEMLTDTKCVVIKQHDTYFRATEGRLKLRHFNVYNDDTFELIYYVRPNTTGPKLCNYKRTSMNSETFQQINEILSHSNGIIGEVKKVRKLYMSGQTRIHVDEVDELGHFMELEVVLSDNQDIEVGEKIAQDLMSVLGIGQDDLISESYIDMLNKINS